MIDFYDDGNCCKPTVKITDTGSMSTYQKLCYVLDKIKEIIDFVNTFQAELDEKEDSVNITNQRKLSESGDFTGTLAGRKNALQTTYEIDDNRQQIQYIASQFSDGQTGFVIDGGFFEETGIKANYNGGYF